ncbi:hypothetical protein EVA_13477 [gut metagenome]|uniref:Uncharacterized protein n=1 Tax=gut metagenome TaxID=749906 RepID=J9G9F7_9ZZZZ
MIFILGLPWKRSWKNLLIFWRMPFLGWGGCQLFQPVNWLTFLRSFFLQ